MRANRDRRGALAFGALANDYERGRPSYSSEFVLEVLQRVGGPPPRHERRALEIGAGTGQLTGALLETGYWVTAVEPAGELRDRLESKHSAASDEGRLKVERDLFENIAATLAPQSFDSIWAADSYHWIDPSIGYLLASQVLKASGLLVLIWSFPTLANEHLQRRLNSVFGRLSPDLVREPGRLLADLDPLLEEGRSELRRSGFFGQEVYWFHLSAEEKLLEDYIALQCSYGHIAQLSDEAREQLRHEIRQTFAENDGRIEVLQYRYVLTARCLA